MARQPAAATPDALPLAASLDGNEVLVFALVRAAALLSQQPSSSAAVLLSSPPPAAALLLMQHVLCLQ